MLDNFGGVTCREVLANLGDYLDGELGDGDVQRFVAHVSQCTRCNQFGARFMTLVRHLQATEADEVPGSSIAKLERRLRDA